MAAVMETPHDILLNALRALCKREGGHQIVAAEAGISEGNLWQVLHGTKLPSGQARGIGRRLQDKISQRYPDWLNPQHAVAGDGRLRGAGAQILSEASVSYSPQVTWEAIMRANKLPDTFRVSMPDDSMHPRVRKGDVLEFDSREHPRSGDGVLVRDAGGTLFFRIYRQAKPGAWEAHPINQDFLPLHSDRDQLAVIGVMVGAPRHRWA